MIPYPWRAALLLGLWCACSAWGCSERTSGPALVGSGAPAGAAGPKPRALPVKLGKLPDLRLAPRPPLTAVQARQIKDLIASLAELDRPDFGLSTTMAGDAFAPLPGQSQVRAFLLTDHRLEPSRALQTLVALGVDALPFLLDALGDQTPTRLTIKHEGGFGAMWHAAELPLNPVNPAEQAVYQARAKQPKPPADEMPQHVKSYTLKIGDVCFVAIGQIVGRSYQAVRYQPTKCIVLNCPAHDPRMRAEVQAIWKSRDARRMLFDSLRADYATETNYESDWWDTAGNFQCGAALRLLYYFPRESAPLVADRLGKLDVGSSENLDTFRRRCVANGLRATYFIKAVAWCKEPPVRDALVGVFKRAEDVESMLAALPAVEDRDLIRRRLEAALAALPADEEGPYGHGFYILRALLQRTPREARVAFERYLRDPTAQRCHTACLVLREVKMSWDADVLGSLLGDKRSCGWTYAVDPAKNEPRRPIRVCDEAAVTLSQNHPELSFTQAGEHADLDRQIAVMRERLARKR
jgi:hypothetical protein